MTAVAAIDVRQAHDVIEAGDAVLIDVREPDEFVAARIEGAILAPLSQMPQAWLALDLPADKTVIVMCRVGGRSGRVRNHLEITHFSPAVGGAPVCRVSGST